MRLFRLAIIAVLLLACVALGAACTGDKGADGVGIQSIANNTDGTLTIYLTNGQSYTTGNLKGTQGEAGPQGAQGIQGPQGQTGLPGAGVTWRGEWDSSTVYGINDAVGYLGSSYVSRQDSNANHVPSDTAWWDLWVAKGDTGVTGADGADGAPGPNMIVAMGSINSDGTIHDAWNVTSVEWVESGGYFDIVLTGIYYSSGNYVTVATPDMAVRYIRTYSASGHLRVGLTNNLGEVAPYDFHFVVLDPDLA